VTIKVPTVIGMTADQATKVLKDAGFTNVKVVIKDGGDAQSTDMGKLVVSVNPSEGTAVVGTTQIILTVEGGGGNGLG
jgi:beta-lactam-binding protein with PASTA domain